MSTKKNNIGFIIGRFQPFHNGHLNYLLEAINLFDEIFVNITNPDPSVFVQVMEDDHRHKIDANIFTYYERLLMVRNTLRYENIDSERVTIVPFPIHQPKLWKYYVPLCATAFIRVFDQWDQQKVYHLSSAGYNVYERKMKKEDRITSGEFVRKLITEYQDLRNYVPKGSIDVINRYFSCRNQKSRLADIA